MKDQIINEIKEQYAGKTFDEGHNSCMLELPNGYAVSLEFEYVFGVHYSKGGSINGQTELIAEKVGAKIEDLVIIIYNHNDHERLATDDEYTIIEDTLNEWL